MPIEYYAGAAIALIVVVLLVLLMKPGRSTRQSAQHNSINADQLAKQLSRIADSLEILVARMGAAATVENPRAEGLRGEDPKPLAKEPLAEVPKAHVEEPRAEEVKPPAEKAPASPPDVVEPSAAEPEKVEQPVERHVRLSMFGR